jgi:hypothetical protein
VIDDGCEISVERRRLGVACGRALHHPEEISRRPFARIGCDWRQPTTGAKDRRQGDRQRRRDFLRACIIREYRQCHADGLGHRTASRRRKPVFDRPERLNSLSAEALRNLRCDRRYRHQAVPEQGNGRLESLSRYERQGLTSYDQLAPLAIDVAQHRLRCDHTLETARCLGHARFLPENGCNSVWMGIYCQY